MSFDDFLQRVGLERPVAIEVPAGHSAFAPAHEPDDADGTQSFGVANGTPLDQRLGFVVGSVIVDNNTSSFLNIPDATKDGTGRWVPPGTGAAMPILGHISRARVLWSAPPGKTQPAAAAANETAQVVFVAAPSPPGFGIAIPTVGAPFQTPNKVPVNFGASIAAGATVALVAGVATQTVYLFYCAMNLDAVPATPADTYLQDTAGTPNVYWRFSNIVTNPWPAQFFGAPIAAGLGFGLKNNAGASEICRGGVVYSQG